MTSRATLTKQSIFSAALAVCGLHLLLIQGTSATLTFADALTFSLLMTSLAFICFLAMNLTGKAFGRFLPKLLQGGATRWNLFLVFSAWFVLMTVVSLRPFWPGFPSHVVAVVAAVIGAALCVRVSLARPVFQKILSGESRCFPMIALFLLIPAFWAPMANANRDGVDVTTITPDDRPDHRIVFIGVDGATFDVLDPLITAGRLPNFEKIIHGGTRAVLQSDPAVNQPMANSASKGMRTPVIWETIYTGHHPKEHRIWDFMSTRIAGMEINLPFRFPLPRIFYRLGLFEFDTTYSTDGQEKRFWEFYEDFGWETMVLGMVDTWPAFQVGGATIVSDRTHRNDRFLCYPESLDKEIGWFYTRFPEFASREGLMFNPNYRAHFNPEEQPDEFQEQHAIYENMRAIKERAMNGKEYPEYARQYMDYEFVADYEEKFSKNDPQYWENHLVRNQCSEISRDLFYFESAIQLLNDRKKSGAAYPKLTTFYYQTTDTVQHWFWKYFQPEAFSSVDAQSVTRCGDIIPKTYEMVDAWLGEILEHVDENTTIVMCSDHGAGAWTEQEDFGIVQVVTSLIGGQADHTDYSGNHRTNGILVVNGPGIKAGAQIEDCSIYDVAPLVLHLSGLPTSEVMIGVVPEDLFTDDFQADHPVRSVPDYGKRHLPQEASQLTEIINSNDDGEIFQRLKELGYI